MTSEYSSLPTELRLQALCLSVPDPPSRLSFNDRRDFLLTRNEIVNSLVRKGAVLLRRGCERCRSHRHAPRFRGHARTDRGQRREDNNCRDGEPLRSRSHGAGSWSRQVARARYQPNRCRQRALRVYARNHHRQATATAVQMGASSRRIQACNLRPLIGPSPLPLRASLAAQPFFLWTTA